MTRNLFKRRGAWWLFATALALGAFFFRFPDLTARPMHTDEAVHAVKLGILMETGTYIYDPHEYHGPLIYYAAEPFVRATGARTLRDIPDETPLRLPIVIFGSLLVFATTLAGGTIGRAEAGYAALLIMLSPAFSFYSRYYIQEVPFTLFCFLALGAAWRLLESQKAGWAIVAGIAAGLAVALKETWIIVLGVAVCTAVILQFTARRRPRALPFPWLDILRVFSLCVAFTFFTAFLFLSNFFRNITALTDTFTAMLGYVQRGVSGDSSTFGAGIHDHPWYYYLQLLACPEVSGPWHWSEAGTLFLGCIGISAVVRQWRSARPVWNFIAVFTVLITALYSAIPYKTPWNVLPMLMGWTLLAGRGFAELISLVQFRRGLTVLILPMLIVWPAVLAVQSWRSTISRSADVRNPYAYSATSPSVTRLTTRALQIAAVAPEGKHMLIQVISSGNDYWPLPWYLRQFDHIGYYTTPESVSPDAAIIIASGDVNDAALAAMGPRQLEYFGLRDGVVLTTLIRQDLWDKFMKGHAQSSRL